MTKKESSTQTEENSTKSEIPKNENNSIETTTSQVITQEDLQNIDQEEQSQSVPITEYEVPTEEDNRKIAEEYKKKQEQETEQPKYATYSEETTSLWKFSSDNGITINDFYELNPGIEHPEVGATYRIK